LKLYSRPPPALQPVLVSLALPSGAIVFLMSPKAPPPVT
jgi:hypothetical protein